MPPIIHIEEIDSTNSYLKSLLLSEKLEEGTIVATDFQTAGRGQRGSGWESKKGENLLFSMLFYPTFLPIQQQFYLSKIVSLGIKQVLDKYTEDITIKWPNDIYWGYKKICGILIENTLSPSGIANSIAGIGININQTIFESNAPNPISLKQITRNEHNLTEILNAVKTNILLLYLNLMDEQIGEIDNQYISSLFRKDDYHAYFDGEKQFEAKIKNIRSTGHLVLETKEDEERVFAFKEVKYIL